MKNVYNMEDYHNSLKKQLEHYFFDVRLEVLLAELLENNAIEFNDVLVRPIGLFGRGYQRDLHDIQFKEIEVGKVKEIDKIIFSVWREGIFDALPEGLFFKPLNRKYKKSSHEIQEEIKKTQQRERAARDFFLPIDHEFFHHKVVLEQIERETVPGFTSETGREVFLKDFWDIDLQDISPDQKTTLLYFLPYAFKFKADMAKLEEVFSAVLKEKVVIRKTRGQEAELADEFIPRLGETFLGINTILGNTFNDGLPTYRIRVLELINKEVEKYLPGRSQDKLIKVLMAFFFPLDYEYQVSIDVRRREMQFKLDNTKHQGLLGLNTILNNQVV